MNLNLHLWAGSASAPYIYNFFGGLKAADILHVAWLLPVEDNFL